MLPYSFFETCTSKPVPNRDEHCTNCPECADTKGHMYFNLIKMVYICHRCGAKGRIVKGSSIDITDWSRAREVLIKSIDREQDYVQHYSTPGKVKDMIVRNLPYSTHIADLSHPNAIVVAARNYLRSRGIDELNKKDILVGLEINGVYSNTVIFPIYDDKTNNGKRIKYFVCRKIDGTEPKYINAPWPKEDAMYYAYGNQWWSRPVDAVIVEGVFDALAVSRAGYRAYALLGKQATQEQLDKLVRKHTVGYLIFLDSDALAHAFELKVQLSSKGVKARVVHVCGHDPDSLANEKPYSLPSLETLLDDESKAFNTGFITAKKSKV